MKSVRTHKDGGFTLIEVLVAFTILVASVSVAVVIFGNGLRVAGVVDEYARAIAVAESRLAELQVAETLLPGESSGAVADDMAWNVRIAPGYVGEARAEAKPDFFRIAVTVIWGGEGTPRSLILHTLLAPPQAGQSPGAEDGEMDEAADGEDAGTDETSDAENASLDGADEE
jgi:general secretion pathway protein I